MENKATQAKVGDQHLLQSGEQMLISRKIASVNVDIGDSALIFGLWP